MGDNFLRKQAKNFKKGRDLAAEKMSQPVLFNRPDLVSTAYTVKPVNGSQLNAGETLLAMPSADGESIDLARGHQTIARIDGDGAKSLCEAMSHPHTTPTTNVHISEVSSLSGVGKASIVKDD